MEHEPTGEASRSADDAATDYETPRVESVLTAEDMEREAHYGGTLSIR